jgi:hypothetical protein
MQKTNKDKSVTIRIKGDTFQKLTNMAIQQSVEQGRIVKMSEIIRVAIDKIV